MKLEYSSIFDTLVKNISKQKSFTLTGLTTFSRLLLIKYIKQISNKKLLFITSTEQAALRYKTDLERIFNISSEILPYQNTSVYEAVQDNLYDYEKQVSVLRNLPEVVIAPAKVLTEKLIPFTSALQETLPKSLQKIAKFPLPKRKRLPKKTLMHYLTQLSY